MKNAENNRTEYQKFLYSLFKKYGIDYIGESWGELEWKVIVDRLGEHDRTNFYKELSEFNTKNPTDQIWTHKNDEKIEEVESIDESEEVESIDESEEVESIDNDPKSSLMKVCPFCAEDIKKEAIKCKHCGEKIKYEGTFEKAKKTSNYFEPPPSYGFFAAVVICFRKYFDFKGRASRSEFFYFQIFSFLLMFLYAFLFTYFSYGIFINPVELIYGYFFTYENELFLIPHLVILLPTIFVTTRRFHDFNISGWWQLLFYVFAFLPVYGVLIAEISLLIVCAKRGNNYENYYDTVKGKNIASGVSASVGSIVVKEKSTVLDIVQNTIIVMLTIVGLIWLAIYFNL